MPYDRDTPFRHSFRVRYAECDPQGVVFNSRYLEYADVLISEFWRALGVKSVGEGSFEVHVARAIVDYRAPIRTDELIEGRIWPGRFGNSSMVTHIELHGTGEDASLRSAIELVQVHVDLETGQSQRIPDAVRALFGVAEFVHPA